MKTLNEFLQTKHIPKPINYVEPYDKPIDKKKLNDGDYFAITWNKCRACGIFKNYVKRRDKQLSAQCYCVINALGDKIVYDGNNYCCLGLEHNDLCPVTTSEYEELSELYKSYKP